MKTGFDFAEVDAPIVCSIGDSKISIVRIAPKDFQWKLFSSKKKGCSVQTVEKWSTQEQLVFVVNAGMYQSDFATNAGYMQIGDFVNNSVLNKSYKSVLALEAKNAGDPHVKLLDLTCDDWAYWKDRYVYFSQCLRLIDCKQSNKWHQQDKYWSMVAVATDSQDRVLFAFSRSPYSVFDFNTMILQLPLDIQKAMYLEGGPEASFYLNFKGKTIAKMGSFETGFKENDTNTTFWPLPNVIGISDLN